ncbi:MAG: complex I subunit 5 family protein [bacterium]
MYSIIFLFSLHILFFSMKTTGEAYASPVFQKGPQPETTAHAPQREKLQHESATGTEHHSSEEAHAHEGERLDAQLTAATANYSFLPWWIILIPLLGALTLFWLRNDYLQGLMVIFTSALTFVFSLLMYPLVIQGQKVGGVLKRGIYYSLPFLPTYKLNLTFKVDPAALTLVIFTGLVWLLVAIFSHDYLAIENKRLRYNIANLGCLSATLGAFLAGDLFTLYVFYECILLFLYLMVIHREDAQALRSAKVYLYFGVFTGLLLLFGIFLFSHFAGSLEIKSAASAFKTIHPGLKYLVAALFLVGFGGKAGVFLEHIWMPSSYGSAPCLTAALSSGIMIEVGAYGIFRTVNMIFAPLGHLESSSAWMTTSHLGYFLIWAGILTMFLGAVNALFSCHALKLLAYSSVSQMGYIIMGIGCAAYMGTEGAMGLAGSVYHIVNHALFKAGLFLSIGAVYFYTRELDIRKLGGLWKELPIAAITFLISALAIAGFPFFNGFASKTMLHHAILEAYQHSVLVSATHTPDSWLRLAEIIFIITAGGTFAYNMKLFGMTFLGPGKKGAIKKHSSGLFMKTSLMLFCSGIVLLGLFPNWLLEHFIGPMLPYFGFSPQSHAYHVIYNIHAAPKHSILSLWYDPIKKTILASPEVIHNLSGGSTAIFMGGIILLVGLGMGFFELGLSPRLSLERLYQRVFELFRSLCRVVYLKVVGTAEMIISVFMVYLWIAKIKLNLIIPEPQPVPAHERVFPIFTGDIEESSPAGQGKRALKGMLKAISDVNEKYVGMVDRAIPNYDKAVNTRTDLRPGGFFEKISQADEKISGSLDHALGEKEHSIFDGVTKVDDQLVEVFDKVIFSRYFWGMLTKAGDLKAGLWKAFYLLEERYDKMIERILFGIIGSEDLSKIKLEASDFSNSWFLKLCKRASEIHTGDISSYISWIAITLTIIIAILVGFLYIQTFHAMIVTATIVIVFFTLLTLLLKR